MTAAAVKCGCCKGPLVETKPAKDPELGTLVCDNCFDLLVKAQRELRKAGLCGCTYLYAPGSNG